MDDENQCDIIMDDNPLEIVYEDIEVNYNSSDNHESLRSAVPISKPSPIPSNIGKEQRTNPPKPPRKMTSAYGWYSREVKDKIKETDPSALDQGNTGKINEELRKKWEEMDPVSKIVYENQAAKDRLRYFEEKRAYKTALQGPKRACSAFTFFSKEVIEGVKERNPNAVKNGGMVKIIKAIGKRWAEMPEADKKRYMMMNQKDKMRYKREKRAHKMLSQSNTQSSDVSNAPKRAMSAFFYFSREQVGKVKESDPDRLKNGGMLELSKEIGKMWSMLTIEEKSVYEDIAKKDSIRYYNEKEAYKTSLKEKQKLESDRKSRPFQCEQCLKTFKRKLHLKRHAQEEHGKFMSSITCIHCNQFFKKNLHLRRHLKEDHPDIPENQLSENTEESIDIIADTNENISTGNNNLPEDDALVQPTLVECSQCYKSFSAKNNLKRHLFRKHGERFTKQPLDDKLLEQLQKVQCDLCYALFRQDKYLRRHKVRTHGIRERFRRSQPFNELVPGQENDTQLNDFPYISCDMCSVVFKHKKYLKRHRLKKHGIKDLSSYDESAQSMVSPSERIECTRCKVLFKHRKYLKRHLLRQHGEVVSMNDLLPKDGGTNKQDEAFEGKDPVEYDKILQCDSCVFTSPESWIIKKHKMVAHERDKPFKCNLCTMSFMAEAYLKNHLENKHESTLLSKGAIKNENNENYTKEKDDTDRLLDELDSSIEKLEGKLETYIEAQEESVELDRMFKCQNCKYAAENRGSLFIHRRMMHTLSQLDIANERIHSNLAEKLSIEIENFIADDNLKKGSKDTSALGNNLKLENGSANLDINSFQQNFGSSNSFFKCDTCSYTSNQKWNLAVHIKTVHEKIKPYNCRACNVGFWKKSNLQHHLESKHNQNKEQDSNEYNGPKDFDILKMLTPKTEIKYDDTVVNELDETDTIEGEKNSNFNSDVIADQNNNFVSANSNKLSCRLCPKQFIWKQHLYRHIRQVHGNSVPIPRTEETEPDPEQSTEKEVPSMKALNLFQCENCEFSGKLKRDLKKHVKIVHENQKVLSCERCDYTTTQRCNLVCHIRAIHDKVKPYQCKLCDYAASQSGNLSQHMKAKHPEEAIKNNLNAFSKKYNLAENGVEDETGITDASYENRLQSSPAKSENYDDEANGDWADNDDISLLSPAVTIKEENISEDNDLVDITDDEVPGIKTENLLDSNGMNEDQDDSSINDDGYQTLNDESNEANDLMSE